MEARKVALLTLGTRGDIQPFIALGKSLKARGHDVVLGAPENFQSWIEAHGLAFRSIGVDMQVFGQRLRARQAMAGNPFAMAGIWRGTIMPLVRSVLDAIWEVGRDADIIINNSKTTAASDVGEATGAAVFHVAPFPIFPSKAFPFFIFPGNYGPRVNRLTYRLLLPSQLIFLPTVNRWREDVLGLRKASPFTRKAAVRNGAPGQLCAVSPSVVPRYPADESEGIQTTGYWFLDEGEDWQPGAKLSDFLMSGDPPIYIGFGSTTSADPARLLRTVVDGVRRAGVRAILATGWEEIEGINLPETIHVIGAAPHDALFKRVRAVVHHGGAGTTAAGLRAGLPTLICPQTVDQPFWGRRVHALGCGPRPQPLKHLRTRQFAEGLLELTNTSAYRVRALEMASAIAGEDGVARAVEIVEVATRGRPGKTLGIT